MASRGERGGCFNTKAAPSGENSSPTIFSTTGKRFERFPQGITNIVAVDGEALCRNCRIMSSDAARIG